MVRKYTRHGETNTPLYKVWKAMRQRCQNPTAQSYKSYGAKGIRVFPEWEDFPIFKNWAILNGYSIGLTIDRIDGKGNYEPSNCRWVTLSENAKNKPTTTHCRKGHKYTPETTYISPRGWKDCLICRRARSSDGYYKNRTQE